MPLTLMTRLSFLSDEQSILCPDKLETLTPSVVAIWVVDEPWLAFQPLALWFDRTMALKGTQLLKVFCQGLVEEDLSVLEEPLESSCQGTFYQGSLVLQCWGTKVQQNEDSYWIILASVVSIFPTLFECRTVSQFLILLGIERLHQWSLPWYIL